VTVVVEPPKEIIVEAKKEVCLPVVKVLVPGIQGPKGDRGPAGENQPLDIDPLQTYLTARGNF
jgi:hypothetical protein